MTVVAAAFFVYFVHHIAHLVRASTLVGRIELETRAAIEREYPLERREGNAPEQPGMGRQATSGSQSEQARIGPLVDTPPLAVVATDSPGYVVQIDVPGLMEQAVRARAAAEVAVRTGDFVRSRATLAYFYGDGLSHDGGGEGLDERRVSGLFSLGRERSVDRDVAFGIRGLVDVAERALSPGVNDPTTAVHCVDTIHDLLWRLAMRELPEGIHTDPHGAVRVVQPTWSWGDYLHLAFDEIRHWGAGSSQVHRRLRQVLDDLLGLVDDAQRRAALEEQRRLLEARLQSDLPEAEHAAVHRTDPTATTPDPRRPSGEA